MNMFVVETGLSGHHKNEGKSFMNRLLFEAGLSDRHKIRVKVSWTH